MHAAEIWDPKHGHWTELAANSDRPRYHSVSLLLPDGTVLHGASGDANVPLHQHAVSRGEPNHEIFQPPYLFKGARPVMSSGPAHVTYGETFTVTTPNAGQITGVRWIRLGSVTHAFDQSARASTLAFTPQADGVSVTAPSSQNRRRPGTTCSSS